MFPVPAFWAPHAVMAARMETGTYWEMPATGANFSLQQAERDEERTWQT